MAEDYQPKHRADGPAVVGATESLHKHDTIKHVLKGTFGTHVPGCPRCEQTEGMPRSITCPKCQQTSWHPEDVWQGYCGACHDFTSPPFIRHAATPFSDRVNGARSSSTKDD